MNYTGSRNHRTFYLLSIIVLLISLAPFAHAQKKEDCDSHDKKIAYVDRDKDSDGNIIDDRTIFVSFSWTITKRDLDATGQPDTWAIYDVTDNSPNNRYYVVEPVERSDGKPTDPLEDIPAVALILNRPLNRFHEYRVFQSRLTFHACPLKAALEGIVEAEKKDDPSTGTGGVPGKPKETGSFVGNILGLGHKSPSKGREDSNIYLSGQIEGARGSKTQFSTDTKLDLPHSTNGFFGEIGPYFNLKASTAKAADADSMDFGVKFRTGHVFPRKLDTVTTGGRAVRKFHVPDKRVLTGITFDLMPGIESDRRFRNINTLLGNRLSFVTNSSRLFGRSLGQVIYIQPFIGYEIGRNIKSPINAVEGRGLSRGLAGASLYLNLTPKKTSGLSFQVDYIRRFLLRRETSFTEDDDKKLIPLFVGRGPRDYVKPTFEFNLTDFTGATISYEHGRLPPNFELVNSKFSFGLVHKFSTKRVK
jgi:hypothetical protein